jgi:hypothetical protein
MVATLKLLLPLQTKLSTISRKLRQLIAPAFFSASPISSSAMWKNSRARNRSIPPSRSHWRVVSTFPGPPAPRPSSSARFPHECYPGRSCLEPTIHPAAESIQAGESTHFAIP